MEDLDKNGSSMIVLNQVLRGIFQQIKKIKIKIDLFYNNMIYININKNGRDEKIERFNQ